MTHILVIAGNDGMQVLIVLIVCFIANTCFAGLDEEAGLLANDLAYLIMKCQRLFEECHGLNQPAKGNDNEIDRNEKCL